MLRTFLETATDDFGTDLHALLGLRKRLASRPHTEPPGGRQRSVPSGRFRCGRRSRCAGASRARPGRVRHVDAGLGDERVRVHPEVLDDRVLQEPMDDDDVRAQQLLPPGDLLEDGRAVVDDELEVQVGDADAGVAGAGRRLAHVAPAPAEAEVQRSIVSSSIDPSIRSAIAYVKAASPSSLASRNVGRRAVTTAPMRSARMSCAWSSSTSAR